MNIRCRIIFFSVIFISCKDQSQVKITTRNKPTVILQPLQFSDTATLSFLKDSIEKFYLLTIVIADVKKFPANFYYKPRNRYRADSTIKWLKQIKPDSARTIVGVTDEDVSVNKGAHKDYGVMGLGYKHGNSCVVSTLRLRKTVTSHKHFQQRLFKVVVHEMGHNFGLDHCPDETCTMVDAEGQMKLDQEKELCSVCRNKLRI